VIDAVRPRPVDAPTPAFAPGSGRVGGAAAGGSIGETVGERFMLRTPDGIELAVTRFAAGAETGPAVLVTAAAGVPQGFYRALARWLAARGSTVCTFDFRGVAASRPSRLRGFEADFHGWAADIDAVLAQMLARHERVAVLGHSVSGLLALTADHAPQVHRFVLVGTQTAYWRDWPAARRVPMALLWHGFMPLVTLAAGYFPGRALRLGEDLPRGVALQWAARPWRDPFRQGKAAAALARALPPVHLVAAHDDAFATPAALHRVQALLPQTTVHRHTIHPAAGMRGLGHFKPLRPEGQACWPRLRRWLTGGQTGEPTDPEASNDGDRHP
jgi:predicted alpha/beta hydrolase